MEVKNRIFTSVSSFIHAVEELELELDRSQQQRMEELRQEIAQARITRQRIVPLMRSMADAHRDVLR